MTNRGFLIAICAATAAASDRIEDQLERKRDRAGGGTVEANSESMARSVHLLRCADCSSAGGIKKFICGKKGKKGDKKMEEIWGAGKADARKHFSGVVIISILMRILTCSIFASAFFDRLKTGGGVDSVLDTSPLACSQKPKIEEVVLSPLSLSFFS